MEISSPASLAESQHYGTSGRHSVHYFQPPMSPIAAAVTPSLLPSGHDYFSTSTRKRQRPDSRDGQHTRNQHRPWADDKAFGSSYGHGSELVNERYRLADGVDTPRVQQSGSRIEQLTVHEDEFRRRLRDDDMDFTMSSGCTHLSGPLARERNGVARVRREPDQRTQTTWTSFAFNIIGKAFSFGSTVFRGFYAGGGRAYNANSSGLVGSDLLQHEREGASTPLPGSWHGVEAEFLGDFEQDSPYFQHESPSRPAVKRRQTDRDSWVLVGSSDLDGRPSSPKRKMSWKPRSSLAVTRPSASRASSRRSLAPSSRRTTSYQLPDGAPAQITTPTQPRSRRASVALTRSPQAKPSSAGLNGALISPEAERFARRLAKQDKAMASMGSRIKEMMRQAQEALGTKYSVEGGNDGMDGEDEGFFNDDW